MRTSHLLAGDLARAAAKTVTPPALANTAPASHDPRWPEITATLGTLYARKRRAVRIVDADCDGGALLLAALRHARTLGFVAIEGRGIDGSPTLIGRARAAAARLRDPAIGVVFDLADALAALVEESDMPADIVLWHGARPRDRGSQVDTALVRAGVRVIRDTPPAAAADVACA